MTRTRQSATRRLLSCVLLGLASAAVVPAMAQDTYPSRAITIVVGYTAGGANDILARIVAEKLSASLSQPVVVVNRPGVSSIVGASSVATAKPDGYTLLMGASGPISFNPSLYKQLPYSPAKDFVPISLVGTFPLVLLTQASNPGTSTLADLIKYSKANPGTANYSSSAASFQLITEMFKRQSGTPFVHIPYKGSSDSVMAVATGDATMTLVDSGPAMAAVKGGRVRPLAITSAARAAYLPDVPTMKEQGIDMAVELWSGLFAPTGTPPAVIARLEQAVQQAVAAPDVQQRITDLSINPKSSTSQELARIVSTEIAHWQRIATEAGIEPN